MPSRMTRVIAVTVIAAILNLSLYQTAAASIIGTSDAINVAGKATALSDVQAVLARDDVRAMLVSHGVDPEDAMRRIEALSVEELATLQHQFDQLPAGGVGLFEVLGITFLVLVILEFTGVTNIFSKF